MSAVRTPRRRLRRLSLPLLIITLVAALVGGATPAVAGPAPFQMPGYDPNQPLPASASPLVYQYESYDSLKNIANPPPDADLQKLQRDVASGKRAEPQFGTPDHLFLRWKEYLDSGRTWGWVRWRNNYVTLGNSRVNGNTFHPALGVAEGYLDKHGKGQNGWQSEGHIAQSPVSGNRNDLFNMTLSPPVIIECKAGGDLNKKDQIDQLHATVETAVATGAIVPYVFGQPPTKRAKTKIKEANELGRQLLRAAGKPERDIVTPRYQPTQPQKVDKNTGTKGTNGSGGKGNGGNGKGQGNGNGQGNGQGNGGTEGDEGDDGTAGTLAGPGQNPVDGGGGAALDNTPASPEDEAEQQRVDTQLEPDVGSDAVTDTEQQLGGVDFSTLDLRYVSDDYHYGSGAGMGYAFSADPTTKPSYGGKAAAQIASDSFFVWLELPVNVYTVNLNPDEPNRIIDSKFGTTDAGRILLQADLQMKKTTAKLIHPDTALGKQFWDSMQGDDKCMSMRNWIVPAPATVRESKDSLYILNAPLQVKSEQQYLKTKGAGGTACNADPAAAQHNEQVFQSLILPKIQDAVNTAPEYADLRRVYYSRVAAQWYRDRYEQQSKHFMAYAKYVDKGDVSRWPARTKWTPQDVFNQYVQSYKQGEFKVTRTTTSGNVVTTETYVFGGVDFGRVPHTLMSASAFAHDRPGLPATVTNSVYGPTTEPGQNQVWLGGLSSARPLSSDRTPVIPPTSSPWFWVFVALPVAAWLAVGGVLGDRRRRRRRRATAS